MFFRVSSPRVQLGPPTDDDLEWILDELARPETAQTWGWRERVGAEVYGGYVEGTVLLLPFANASGTRVGFIMLMRIDVATREWSVNIVVPDSRRRNGFTALAALDALCHLVFDVRGDMGLRWRIEPANGASRVLPRRLGYPKRGDVVLKGTTYEEYAIGLTDWSARKARLRQRDQWPDYRVRALDFEDVAHGRVLCAVRGGR